MFTPLSAQSSLQSPKGRILLLFSYHAGHEWEDSIYSTLIKEMKEQVPGTDFYLEYMDTKRSDPALRSPAVMENLKSYPEDWFSLIVAVDDNALQFLADHTKELFPSVPIVFCGINGYEAMKPQLPEDVTGIVSRVNLKDTLQLARQLLPDLKKVHVLSDPTPTGEGNRQMIRDQLDSLPPVLRNLKFHFVQGETMSTRDMLDWSAGLEDDSIILMTSWYRDRLGAFIGERDLIESLKKKTAVPVFNLLHIRPGLLGGKVTSGSVQAELAAEMVSKILSGVSASSIPVIQSDTSIYTIDYQRLRHWGFHTSQLPAGTQLLNPSVLYRYRVVVILVIIIFLVLLILLLSLGYTSFQLHKTGSQLIRQKDELYITLSSIGDGVISTDSEARVVFMNRIAERLTGWTLEDAVGRKLDEVFMIHNAYSRRTTENPVHKVLETGKIVELANHTVLKSRDGVEYQIADSAAPIREPEGRRILGVVLVFRDVSDSYRIQTALKDEQRRLQDAQETARVGNWEYDSETEKYWYSQEIFHLLGIGEFNKDPFATVNLLGELFPGWVKGDPLPFSKSMSSESNFVRMKGSGDEPLILYISARQVETPDKRKQIVTGIIQDVSELTKTKEALELSREQLRQAARMEAVGKLAGGISHEFNNLLQVIMGYAQLLKEEKLDERALSMVDPILRTASSARNLTRQLLLFSRKESSDKKNLSLSVLIKSLLPILDRLVEADIRLETDLEGEQDWIFGDPQQMEQVIINLCLNARDAITGGGLLKITQQVLRSLTELHGLEGVIPPGNYVHISIADNGSGIPAEILPEIFDPFFTTKDKEQGTGLGLSIVYGIIKQHKGYIHIDTDSEKGTVFHIYFPQSASEEESAILSPSIEASRHTNGIIAIAEDDPMVRQLTEKMIEGLGYRFISFTNGKELVDYLKNSSHEKGPITLFLLDVVMPEMGGEDAYRAIRSMGYQTPVLFSSGYTRERLENLNSLENTRLLHKPFTTKEIESLLNELLSD